MKKGHLHTNYRLSYKLGVMRAGEVVLETPMRPHLITDSGLDLIGTESELLNLLKNCILGTNVSPDPVRRDDGAVTFTQTGTTITASSPFFVATDTGRLFKWGTGSAGAECYLTYVDSTHATSSVAAEVPAPDNGTVWYVNTAAIKTPIAGVTWTKQATGNSSVASVVGDTCTWTHTTVNVSSVIAAPVTVTEIAIHTSTTNASVFDRDIVSPPVAFLAGDQAIVTLVWEQNYSSVTPVSVGNVATGYDSSGDFQIESLIKGGSVSGFNLNGTITGPGNLAPAITSKIGAITAAITLQPFSTATAPAHSQVNKDSTLAGYGTGTYFRDCSVTFSISEANGTIYGVTLTYTGSQSSVTQKFTTPFTKLNTQTLAVTFRKSWSRVLTN